MKVESSKPELIEAWAYGLIGAGKGIYEQYLHPLVEEKPVLAYMLCGAIGGIAVAKLLGTES